MLPKQKSRDLGEVRLRFALLLRVDSLGTEDLNVLSTDHEFHTIEPYRMVF